MPTGKMQSANIIHPKLNSKALSETWSEKSYNKYKTAENTWRWNQFPNFNFKNRPEDPLVGVVDGSILEIGCAAGAAYRFLKDSSVLEANHDYTGMDISTKGITYCKEKHQEPNWVQTDVVKHIFDRHYDYSFERIAIHHMEDPLSVVDKLLTVTNKSFSMSFVGCLNGRTISDLEIARYRGSGGEMYFFNIINCFEVMEVMADNGFRDITLHYAGTHEQIYSDPLALQYIAPEINVRLRRIVRATIVASKSGDKFRAQLVNGDTPVKHAIKIFLPKHRGNSINKKLIQKRLASFNERTYGVLYKSAYQAL